jgi:hypothetical protein
VIRADDGRFAFSEMTAQQFTHTRGRFGNDNYCYVVE